MPRRARLQRHRPVTAKINTRAWRKLAATFKTACRRRNAPCWLCGQSIDYDAPPQAPEAFEADHYRPRDTHPHLALDPTNLRPSHSSCNRSRGTAQPGTWHQADW